MALIVTNRPGQKVRRSLSRSSRVSKGLLLRWEEGPINSPNTKRNFCEHKTDNVTQWISRHNSCFSTLRPLRTRINGDKFKPKIFVKKTVEV